MTDRSKSALVHILIAKSIIETLLVAAVAIGFFFDAFPPYFKGWGEATPHAIEGWAVSTRNQSQRVEVQLFIDDSFIATGFADRLRPDVATAGQAADPWHGYSFGIPTLNQGNHVARIYAVHSSGRGARKTLQLLGDPIPFAIDAEGISHWIPLARRGWFE